MDLGDLGLSDDEKKKGLARYARVVELKLKIAKVVEDEDPLISIPAMIETAAIISGTLAAYDIRGGAEFLGDLIESTSTLYADIARAAFPKAVARLLMLRGAPSPSNN